MKTGVGFSLPAESSGTQARALRLFLLNHWRGFKRCRRTKENTVFLSWNSSPSQVAGSLRTKARSKGFSPLSSSTLWGTGWGGDASEGCCCLYQKQKPTAGFQAFHSRGTRVRLLQITPHDKGIYGNIHTGWPWVLTRKTKIRTSIRTPHPHMHAVFLCLLPPI